MSKWRVFNHPNGWMNHTAPCDDDGTLLPPHELSITCRCKPEVEYVEVQLPIGSHPLGLVKHRDPERGLDA